PFRLIWITRSFISTGLTNTYQVHYVIPFSFDHNIWRITPAHDKRHPAVFPLELAERVISYYSFKKDVVLDPFAGIGTVGRAAVRLDRRFVLIEREKQYVEVIRHEAKSWLGHKAKHILTINCSPIDISDTLF
ncbi:site-specific DNA-methyltransferase, partial [Anaerolineae bacterium CFX8]|nr:site-specific DNA-methyltransferase [Anaerolineae bacterium CFX8]